MKTIFNSGWVTGLGLCHSRSKETWN